MVNLKKSAGVTLIELLVVLAIAAILAQIALPEFSDIMKNNRAATRINELQTSLTFARSEAVKRNSTVLLCKSSDAATCQDSGTSWQNGWIVFADMNGNGTVDAGELLTTHGIADDKFTLTFAPARVAYAGTGLATLGMNGTYKLCDDRGSSHARGLIIGPGGRPRLAIDSNENGVAEDAAGDDLVCS